MKRFEMARSSRVLLVFIVISVILDDLSFVIGRPAHVVVPTPNCSYRTLKAAAKCKCSMLENFLPPMDGRIKLCRYSFGQQLNILSKNCSLFSVGATSNYNLAAMFAIEKLGGLCFPLPACASYSSKSALRTKISKSVKDETTPIEESLVTHLIISL